MVRKIWLVAVCVCSVILSVRAQIVNDSIANDSIIVIREQKQLPANDSIIPKDSISLIPQTGDFVKISTDSIITAEDKNAVVPALSTSVFKPNPTRAVLYSAIFPGLGQIYNRKYWKLPIVYGGFMGCAYAIMWNNRYYSTYKKGYLDIMDDDESTDSWKDALSYWQRQNITPEKMKWLQEVFKKRKDYYRYYRDLSIIVTIGVYALCMVDAYVDAQLYDFDISPDLSMRIEPVVFQRSYFAATAVGFNCSFSF